MIIVAVATASHITAALIPPRFLDCVVAIGYRPLVTTKKPDGSLQVQRGIFVPMASGLLYAYFLKKANPTENEYAFYLVTNQHVVADVERAERQQLQELSKTSQLHIDAVMFLRFNPKALSPAREDFSIPIDSARPGEQWTQDRDIDLAVIPVGREVLDKEGIQYNFFQSDLHVADRSKAEELGITEGDYIYVLGFPMGLVGTQRNYVIARQGIIARIRDSLASNVPIPFLIDAFVFPGNSGGPVITRPEMAHLEGTKTQDHTYLVGVVKGYIPYQDVAVSKQTGQIRIMFQENSGLAEVIPMDAVTNLIQRHRTLLQK